MRILSPILLFLALQLSAQIPPNKNTIDSKGKRQGTWTITYNQNWVETELPDSIVFYRIISYINDKPHGITTDYYLDGNKQFEGTFLAYQPEEIIQGKAIWYFQNGVISRVSNFNDGLREGKDLIYYESGKVYLEASYQNGLVDGRVPYYSEDGKIEKVEYYDNDNELSFQALWDTAIGHYNSNQFSDSEPLLADLYLNFKNEFGHEHENTVIALALLWKAQLNVGKFDEAIHNSNELRRIRESQNIPQDSIYRDWLFEMVLYFKKAEKLDLLESQLLKVLTIQKEISAEPNENYLAYSRTLADFYRFRERTEEAEKVYNSNIQLLKAAYPNQPELYSYDLGALFTLKQENTKAESLHLEAIDLYRAKQDTSFYYGVVLKQLAELYDTQGKYDQAIPFALELANLQKLRKGKYSSEYSEALMTLSTYYRETNDLKHAEIALTEMEEIVLEIHGLDSRDYSNAIRHKADYYHASQNNERAEKAYLQSAKILHNIPFPTYDDLLKEADILSVLGGLYTDQRDLIKAQPVLTEAYEIITSLTDQNYLSVAGIYSKIGVAQEKIENYGEAEACHKTAMQIVKNVYGITHHYYHLAVANLCSIYAKTDRIGTALTLLDEQLALIEKEKGRNNLTYISLLESKIIVYRKQRSDTILVNMNKESAEFYKNQFGQNHPTYTSALMSLCFDQMGVSIPDAEANIQLLESILKKQGIKKTDKEYGAIYDLKYTIELHKDDKRAQLKVANKKASAEESRGEFPDYIRVGMSYFVNNQPKQAKAAYQKYFDKVMTNVHQIFPYLTDDQKVGFYNSEVKYHLDMYYALALAEVGNLKFGQDSIAMKKNNESFKKLKYIKHPNMDKIFNYQLITKGILFEASQKMKQSVLESSDESLIQLLYDWQAKKDELNKIFQQPDSNVKAQSKEKLSHEIKIMERQLAINSSYFNQAVQANYSWKDIRDRLKPDEALIEVLAISAGIKLNPGKYKTSDYYLAFIITPETKEYPLCVKIGSGDDLETKSLKNYQNCIRYKISDTKSYDSYWKVLADTLKGTKKVYFATDGIYHKVNVNTLQNPATGKYVLEEKEIQFITQARDFIQHRGESISPENIILFGDPNFNSLPGELGKQEDYQIKTLKIDTTQRFFNGAEISELPGTKAEVINIGDLARKNNLRIQSFMGDEANEAVLKQINSPSILHIATHGFFMPESVATNSDVNVGFANFLREDLKNPLRRSGLLLSHCRHAFNEEKTNIFLQEDGILTADEAQNLNLDKTEMVVLSACETGLGEVKNGEGVYGLQRAFQTAGAKSVLMSLWTVSDEATQELMTTFYSRWFVLKDKREAFRQAQLSIKEKYKDPYYWGAFVLIGE